MKSKKLTDEVDECENQIRVQAKKVRSKPKRKKENDARIEADSEIVGSFLDECARQQTSIYTKAFTQAMKLQCPSASCPCPRFFWKKIMSVSASVSAI